MSSHVVPTFPDAGSGVAGGALEHASSRTLYRRTLPVGSIPFSSPEGRAIFREALASGTMEGYFALAEQFHTQGEPSFCGLGTLVIILNALAIDPGRIWKGSWRWFSEDMLDCCRPLDEIKNDGITLAELVCLARCNGARAEAHRPEHSSLAALRAAVREAASTPDRGHLVAAYDRAALGQTGAGHFSPIGGYHEARDLVLLLDVARFKYPPHWVPLEQLWEAMKPLDPATGKSRGFVRLSRGTTSTPSLFNMASSKCAWRATTTAVLRAVAGQPSDGPLAALSPSALEALTTPKSLPESEEHARVRTELLAQIRATALYAHVARKVAPPLRPEIVTLLVYGATDAMLSLASPSDEDRGQLAALRTASEIPPLLQAEITSVRSQLESMTAYCRTD